jgi:hypothetical protein
MKINPSNQPIKNFKPVKSPPAEAFAFPLLCGYHAYDDYKKEKNNKQQVFLTNLFVLTGTSLGAVAGYKIFSKMIGKAKNIKQIKKDTIETIGAPLGGLLGGFGFSTISSLYLDYKDKKYLQKTKPSKTTDATKTTPTMQQPPPTPIEKSLPQKVATPKKQSHPLLKQLGIISATIGGAVLGNRLSSIALQSKSLQKAKLTMFSQNFISAGSIAIGAGIGLATADRIINKKDSVEKKAVASMDMILTEVTPNVSSFDAVKERNLQSRIQKSFYEIISGIVVPSAIVLPTLFFVRDKLQDDKVLDNQLKFLKKISNNRNTQRTIAEKAVTIPLAIATYFIGDKVGQVFDEKVTKRILDKEFFDELEKNKKQPFILKI